MGPIASPFIDSKFQFLLHLFSALANKPQMRGLHDADHRPETNE
jgi:hypothetical protein